MRYNKTPQLSALLIVMGVLGVGCLLEGELAEAESAPRSATAALACEPGTTTTAWATSCPTAPPACTPGTWTAGGPDPDHTNFTLVRESAHFAIYSDEAITSTTAQAALDTLENTIWKAYFGSPIFFKEPLCNLTSKTKVSVHVHSNWGLSGGGLERDADGDVDWPWRAQ